MSGTSREDTRTPAQKRADAEAKLTNLYTRVTERVIQHLKEGVPSWVRPWKVSGRNGIGIVPSNAVTGRPYSGGNILILWATAEDRSYPSNAWLTYQQANELKGRVRKGEKATQILYIKYTERDVEEDGKKVKRRFPFARLYSVFNVAQVDNLPAVYAVPVEAIPAQTAYDHLMETVKATGARIEYGGSKAAYFPNRDFITMPNYGSFHDDEGFYGTLCHELVHWTGPETRLNRRFGKHFGDEQYAAEELVAELGSAFLCAHHGVEATFRSATYIANWLKVLENDNKAIFRAASYASQAANFIMETTYAVGEDTPEVERQAAE